MLIGRDERLQRGRRPRKSLAGSAGSHARCRPDQPDPCVHHDHPASRPGGERSGADLPGDRLELGPGRRPEQGRHDLFTALLQHPTALPDPDHRPDLLHQPEYAGLHRLPAHPVAWYYINRTRPGMHLRAVGEYPAAADALGINVYRQRYFYVFCRWYAGGSGWGNDQPGGLAGLVQRTDHCRCRAGSPSAW